MIGDVLAPSHLLLILIVALLVLGPKRLPEVGKSLGRGLRDFRDAMNTYSPGNLLSDDEPHAHPPEAEESELRREPPVAAATAQSAPEAPAHTIDSTESRGVTGGTAAADADEPTPTPVPAAAPAGAARPATVPEDDTKVLEGEIVPERPAAPTQG
jgi:TatA/E family protein of Tat protein translocase